VTRPNFKNVHRLKPTVQLKDLSGHHTIGIQTGGMIPSGQLGDGFDAHEKVLKNFEREKHRAVSVQ
jgi:hypothetical protein